MTDSLIDKFNKLTTNEIMYNQWNKWSSKSELIPFVSNEKGKGDGENKVAVELDTSTKGQNSCYDMDIKINNLIYKADVKKLDNNTFNTGVDGRDTLRHIKNKLDKLIFSCNMIYNEPALIFTTNERDMIKVISKISPDEVCVGNIKKIKKILNILNNKKKEINNKLKNNFIYDIFTGIKKEITNYKFYKLLLLENKNIDEIINIIGIEDYSQIKLLEYFDHTYINEPILFETELNNLSEMFDNYILIFVDKLKGFYIMTNPSKNTNFIRITRGNPRFIVAI